jgi:outer membrane lipoprotein carrier protein
MNRRHALRAIPVIAATGLVLSGLGGARSIVGAQEAPNVDVVAARVQAFYDQTRSLEARFQQHFWHRVYARTQSSRGRVAIDRIGHRVRFDYEQPSGKVLVSDGREWTLYEPDPSGGAGQYVRGSAARASTGALGFLMGTTSISDFHRSLRVPSRTQPPNTDALELRPRRPDPQYLRIIVFVDNRRESAGVVHRVSIEDPDGNWNRFDFTELRFNRALDASMFRFTPPAGAREITGPQGTR